MDIARTQKVRLAGLLLMGLLAGAATGAAARDLMVLTEEYPPITFSNNEGKATGLDCEVVEEIQRRVGNRSPIQIVPWARGYKLALIDPDVALFATMRTTERETLFKWVGPLNTVKTSLYAKRGSPLRITGLPDAKSVDRILVPREYYSHQFLRQVGFTNLGVVNTPEMMVRMLVSGRGALMATDNQTLPTLLAMAGAEPGDAELRYTFMESQSYVAFSKDTSDEVVRQWQHALDEMKRDGSFARLYEKWLPGETPPGIKPSPSVQIER